MTAYENLSQTQQTEPVLAKRMLRRKDVEFKTGFSRATIYRLMKQRLFPPCYNIGSRAVAWDEQEVDAWLMERKEQSKAF